MNPRKEIELYIERIYIERRRLLANESVTLILVDPWPYGNGVCCDTETTNLFATSVEDVCCGESTRCRVLSVYYSPEEGPG